MNDRYFIKGESILVPIKLDQPNEALIPWLVTLARLFAKKVRFIHVVQPWIQIPMQSAYSSSTILQNLKSTIQTNGRAEAEQKLEHLIKCFPSDIDVSYRIREGNIVDCILAESTEEQTSFILMTLGRPKNGHREWLEGVSTPFSVLALSSLPVFLIQSHIAPPDFEENLKLLLADDLRTYTEAAMQLVFDLMKFLPNMELHQIHVCELDEEKIRKALDNSHSNGMSPGELEYICVDDVLQDTCRRLEERLTKRVEQYQPFYILSKKTYVQKVLIGDIVQQLDNYLRLQNPDLLVFGRHHALHQRPFSVGRLGYRFALEQHRPVLMVPNFG